MKAWRVAAFFVIALAPIAWLAWQASLARRCELEQQRRWIDTGFWSGECR